MSEQNNLERLKDLMDRGLMTADQANVQKVLNERVLVVRGTLTKAVRGALNAAVRNGELKRKKKENGNPEIYYHPSFEHLANEALSKRKHETLRALAAVCG